MKNFLPHLGLAIRIGAIVVFCILSSLFLGLWIDSRFHLSPWGVICLANVGILVATVAVYILVSSTYAQP